MSWLRIDDGFTKHPKLAGWSVGQKWAWLEVLEYCARYDTGGILPNDLGLMPRSTTAALLRKAEESGLLDVRKDAQRSVHDWLIYNGTSVGEKVGYYLEKHPEATANEVCKAVGGTREIVLSEVAKWRNKANQGGSGSGTDTGSGEPRAFRFGRTTAAGTESGSESGSRAREPYPSPEELARAVPEVHYDEEHPEPQPAGEQAHDEQPSDLTIEQLTQLAAPRALP